MASLFLSYDRDHASVARVIATALERAGHSVWWDWRIGGGTEYAQAIEQALDNADVVVVLWTSSSIASPWVRDEAGAGRDRGRLVPLSLEGTQPPIGFRQFQAIDLGMWRGRGRVPKLQDILDAIERQSKDPGIPVPVATSRVRGLGTGPSLNTWMLIALGIGMFFVIVGLLIGRPWEIGSSYGTPTVSVGAADETALSQEMARNLLVKLGSQQTDPTKSVRVIDSSAQSASKSRERADFALEVGARSPVEASLLLKDARNGAILWTAEFQRPAHEAADLRQQLAFTSRRVIECGAEARASDEKLRPETLKSYLNVCSQLSDILGINPSESIEVLLRVVREAPRFRPAWSKLLVAETEAARISMNGLDTNPQPIADLRKVISEARHFDPDLPEVKLAEAFLLETSDLPGMMEVIDETAARFPNNPEVLNAYSGALGKVGRLRASAEAASKAVELDPLSPFLRNIYISSLAYSGAFDAARRELARAEQLWPGAASVRDAQFRFNYRYGDPRIARAIFDEETTGGGKAIKLYLDARLDPSPAKVQLMLDYVRDRLAKMENPSAGLGFAIQAYAQFAGKEKVLPLLMSWPKTSDLIVMADVFFRPDFRETRSDRRFMRVAKRIGLVDYWQKSGKWPDFCFEADFTYDCKAEAAKLQ